MSLRTLHVPCCVKACSEDRSIGKAAQEFLERGLGLDAPTGH